MANMQPPGPVALYHEPMSLAYRLLLSVRARGTGYTYEDVTWNAWAAILAMYFPSGLLLPPEPIWLVAREPYRSLGPEMPKRPDFVVLQLFPRTNPTLRPPAPPMMPQRARDYLWVDCKAPSHDTHAGWHNLISEIITRLLHAHPFRPVAVIAAVGLKCLYFLWDPTDVFQTSAQHLPIHISGFRHKGPFDGRLKIFGDSPFWYHLSGEIWIEDAVPLAPWDESPLSIAGQRALNDFLLWVVRFPWEQYGYNPDSWQS